MSDGFANEAGTGTSWPVKKAEGVGGGEFAITLSDVGGGTSHLNLVEKKKGYKTTQNNAFLGTTSTSLGASQPLGATRGSSGAAAKRANDPNNSSFHYAWRGRRHDPANMSAFIPGPEERMSTPMGQSGAIPAGFSAACTSPPSKPLFDANASTPVVLQTVGGGGRRSMSPIVDSPGGDEVFENAKWQEGSFRPANNAIYDKLYEQALQKQARQAKQVAEITPGKKGLDKHLRTGPSGKPSRGTTKGGFGSGNVKRDGWNWQNPYRMQSFVRPRRTVPEERTCNRLFEDAAKLKENKEQARKDALRKARQETTRSKSTTCYELANSTFGRRPAEKRLRAVAAARRVAGDVQPPLHRADGQHAGQRHRAGRAARPTQGPPPQRLPHLPRRPHPPRRLRRVAALALRVRGQTPAPSLADGLFASLPLAGRPLLHLHLRRPSLVRGGPAAVAAAATAAPAGGEGCRCRCRRRRRRRHCCSIRRGGGGGGGGRGRHRGVNLLR
eukprot:Rhum_TRINITY_DN14576_c4_g3::Rhum_TRINITY_DN14576_c4_g3_i1::g.93918::m.93918